MNMKGRFGNSMGSSVLRSDLTKKKFQQYPDHLASSTCFIFHTYDVIINLLRSLSCDRPLASSKVSSPGSVVQCFLFQILEPSLFRKIIQQLIMSSSFPLLFPSILSSISLLIAYCRRQFLRKMRPIQLSYLLFIPCWMFLSSLALRNRPTAFFTRTIHLIFSILH